MLTYLNGSKTGLVLAGGGAKGAYQIGAYKALKELGFKFDVIVGTSIGAMNAYILSQGKDAEAETLWTTMKTKEVFDMEHILKNKGLKFTTVKNTLNEYFSEEAARNSDIRLGVCTTVFPEKTPKYVWADKCPEGKLLEYVLASCTLYPVVPPAEIDGVRYIDGGFCDYMPVSMALDAGCDRIIAVHLNGTKAIELKAPERYAKSFMTVIRSDWDLGSVTEFSPEHGIRNMELGYLDTMKTFGVYEGYKYTFKKGSFSWKEMEGVDEAAFALDMPSGIVYNRESFIETMKDCIRIGKNLGHSPKFMALDALCEALRTSSGVQKFTKTFDKLGTRASLEAAKWLVENGYM